MLWHAVTVQLAVYIKRTQRVSKEHLEYQLKRAQEDNDRPRIRRVKTLLNRYYPTHLDAHPVS